MRKAAALFAIIHLPMILCAQKIQLMEGSLAKLKGTKTITVQMIFDSLLVGAEIPEQAFIDEKKKLWDEKEAGKGSEWESHWEGSKSTLYGPTFSYIFAKNAGLKLAGDAPYIMIVKTQQIEPGWSGGIMGGRSFISAEAWIAEASNPERVVAKLRLPISKSDDFNGGDFEMGRRIQQAYVAAAELLGKYFKDKVL